MPSDEHNTAQWLIQMIMPVSPTTTAINVATSRFLCLYPPDAMQGPEYTNHTTSHVVQLLQT